MLPKIQSTSEYSTVQYSTVAYSATDILLRCLEYDVKMPYYVSRKNRSPFFNARTGVDLSVSKYEEEVEVGTPTRSTHETRYVMTRYQLLLVFLCSIKAMICDDERGGRGRRKAKHVAFYASQSC